MYMKIGVLALAASVLAQDYQEYDEASIDCPEQNDKYYECVDGLPETKFCPDGLLFDASDPNSELCDYPFNVDCGAREYVQEPEEGLDPKCTEPTDSSTT